MKRLDRFIEEKIRSGKYSDAITLHITMSGILFALYSIATMFWLCLIHVSDTTAIRLLFGLMAVLYGIRALRYFFVAALEIWQRRYRRKCGILEDPIDTDHGATLADVIEGIRNEKVEFVAYFSPSGEKICESTVNCTTRACVADKYHEIIYSQPGCVSVHNHPSDENRAFSTNDILSGVRGHLSRIIVVTRPVCYVMDFPKDHGLSVKEVEKFLDDLPTDVVIVGKNPLTNAEANGLPEGLCDQIASPDCIASVMRCAVAAAHFGFYFWITPTDRERNGLFHGK